MGGKLQTTVMLTPISLLRKTIVQTRMYVVQRKLDCTIVDHEANV